MYDFQLGVSLVLLFNLLFFFPFFPYLLFFITQSCFVDRWIFLALFLLTLHSPVVVSLCVQAFPLCRRFLQPLSFCPCSIFFAFQDRHDDPSQRNVLFGMFFVERKEKRSKGWTTAWSALFYAIVDHFKYPPPPSLYLGPGGWPRLFLFNLLFRRSFYFPFSSTRCLDSLDLGFFLFAIFISKLSSLNLSCHSFICFPSPFLISCNPAFKQVDT